MTDIQIAHRYVAKIESAKSKGIDFSLSFCEFKRLMFTQRCRISRVLLTDSVGRGGTLLQTDRTIDRIDASKGYETGNVMAVCHGVNNFKSRFEGDSSVVTPKIALKILSEMVKRERKKKKIIVTNSVDPTLYEVPPLKFIVK